MVPRSLARTLKVVWMEQAALKNSYNELAYTPQAYRETAVERLELIAKIRGLEPASSANSNILELGCGQGMNLIPMAFRNPQSQFLGIDFSENQINFAKKFISELGLNNIDFQCQDIFDFEAQGQYDFVVAHGVLSWIPRHQQQELLSLVSKLLSPDGVGYVSYNCFPGWYGKKILRDFVLAKNSKLPSAEADLVEVFKQIESYIQSTSKTNPALSAQLKYDFEDMKRRPRAYLLHDEFELESHALYFSEFRRFLEAEKLFYAGDTLQDGDLLEAYSSEMRRALAAEKLSADLFKLEEISDFYRNRRFRRSIFSKKKAETPSIESLSQFYVRSKLKAIDGESSIFQHPTYGNIEVQFSVLIEALQRLEVAGPAGLSMKSLLETYSEASHRDLLDRILYFFRLDLLELWPSVLQCSAFKAEQNPKVSDLVLHQAKHKIWLTGATHESVAVDETACEFIEKLDGKHSVEDLVKQMTGHGEEAITQTLKSFGDFALLI